MIDQNVFVFIYNFLFLHKQIPHLLWRVYFFWEWFHEQYLKILWHISLCCIWSPWGVFSLLHKWSTIINLPWEFLIQIFINWRVVAISRERYQENQILFRFQGFVRIIRVVRKSKALKSLKKFLAFWILFKVSKWSLLLIFHFWYKTYWKIGFWW